MSEGKSLIQEDDCCFRRYTPVSAHVLFLMNCEDKLNVDVAF